MGKQINDQKNATRADQEGKESMTEVRVNAPQSRYQDDQQVNNVDTTLKTSTPETSFTRKTVKSAGGTLKQEIASQIVKGGLGGPSNDVSSPSSYGLKSLEYSGDSGTILGNAADTPVMRGNAQGKTRVDKRLSDPNKDINYIATDQIIVEYDNIPALSESQDTVGYNGNPKNTAARIQKNTGASSAELLYDRSLDIIQDDVIVFTSGQVVKQNNVDYGDYPTITQEAQANGRVEEKAYTSTRGNYMPREIVVKLKQDNGSAPFVSSFEVVEDNISSNNESFSTINRAATNEKIFINQAELARQRIDSKCGSPSQAHFNPLGRSILEETATVGYLRDREAGTGAALFTAYKMANKARAYYLARTAKDGQDLITPAIDALYGHLMNSTSSKMMKNDFESSKTADDARTTFKNTAGMKAGSAAIMLGIFDSWGKYKTKADIINQPRGLKLHFQTADNVINPFKVDKMFVAALNSVDVYSTIDRGYDPMNAICATDGVRLVYPYSWRDSLKFTRAKAGDARTYDDQLFSYVYSAGSGLNAYQVKCADPLLNGVAYFIEMHAAEIFSSLGGTAGQEVEWHIPTVHYGLHFGLWDFLLMASAPYIVYERTNTMKDILDYEVNFEYPFDGLVSIADANPMNAVNYRNISSMAPLIPGQMMPSSAIRWIMPELFQKMGAKGVMLPYYYSEDDLTATGTSKTDLNLTVSGGHAFTTVVIRSGIKLAFLDDLASMDPKSLQLCYDRMVRYPFISAASAASASKQIANGVVYKYSQDSEGIPVVTDVTKNTSSLIDVLSTPRQMGWFMRAFSGVCHRHDDCKPAKSNNVIFQGPSDLSTILVKDFAIVPACKAIEYKSIKANERTAAIETLDPAAVIVNRAQAFTQCWFYKHANGGADVQFDLSLAVGENDESKTYSPFVFSSQVGAENRYDGIVLKSNHAPLWSIIQKTPFILSPFNVTYGGVDPFQIAYVFGLAGFMAADYAEEDYNRANQVMNQGYGYTVDPFVKDSPVFKDAMKYTQVG